MGVAEEAVVNVEAEFTANGDALNWRSRRKQDGDQNEVLLALVKGKPLTPRDAENELGIKQGHGRMVLEFDAPESRMYSRRNARTKTTEWVADEDLKITNIRVVR